MLRSQFAFLIKEGRLFLSQIPKLGLLIAFYGITIFLFVIAQQGNFYTLKAIGPSIIWTGYLLMIFLSLPLFFEEDEKNGLLEVYFFSPLSFEIITLIKSILHWFILVIPVILFLPLAAILLNLNLECLFVIILTFILATPFLSFFGCFSMALLVGNTRSAFLAPLILIPFYTPVAVFGTIASNNALVGQPYEKELLILMGLSFMATALGPWVTSIAIKFNLE